MHAKKIEIPFKEDRAYVQGPDLYNAMMAEISAKKISDIHFSVHAFLRKNQCRIYKTDTLLETKPSLPLPAHLTTNADGKDIFLFIEEDPLVEAAPKKVRFDEEAIHAICTNDHESISISDTSPFSFMETVVSMKKELMMRIYPGVEGKWIFTKADLKSRFEKQSNLKIKLLHNMQFKLIKSAILHKSEIIGHLYFSLLKS